MRGSLLTRLESIDSPAILVIGDLILDLYVWGDVERISPEAPVQVLKVGSEEERPGGAGNVAANLAALGARVFCCGVVGNDAGARSMLRALRKLKIDTTGVIQDKGRPTTVKTRMIAHSQQLLRVDREDVHSVSRSILSALLKRVNSLIPSCDAVLLSDYGKGAMPDRLIAEIITACKEKGIPTLIDPARGRDYRVYRGCSILKPNLAEAAMASGVDITDADSLEAAAQEILGTTKAKHLVITQGAEGMTIFRKSAEPVHISGLSRPVYDITGAGDTVLSLLGYVTAGKGKIEEAAETANVAGGIVVGKIGAAPVTKAEIVQELLGFHQIASHKIKGLDEIASVCEEHRRRKQKIVFTNGCFDLLHAGHIKLFQFARNNGEILIVGLNSDSSVRKLKGAGRPVLDQNERAYVLSALEQVDYIVIFGQSTPLKLIKEVRPDVLVKGADYTKATVVGRDLVESYGGKVELAPLLEGASSTGIMSRIAKEEKPQD